MDEDVACRKLGIFGRERGPITGYCRQDRHRRRKGRRCKRCKLLRDRRWYWANALREYWPQAGEPLVGESGPVPPVQDQTGTGPIVPRPDGGTRLA